MITSETTDVISAALSAAQGCMKPAAKSSINPHFKSKYADLSSILDAIREPLATNGLSVMQDTRTVSAEGGGFIGVSVGTRSGHKSGQWREVGPLTVPLSKIDSHGVGSASTYAKRYSLVSALNVAGADIDDDGNIAVEKAVAPPKAPDNYADILASLADAAQGGSDTLNAAWKIVPLTVQIYIREHDARLQASMRYTAGKRDSGVKNNDTK